MPMEVKWGRGEEEEGVKQGEREGRRGRGSEARREGVGRGRETGIHEQ